MTEQITSGRSALSSVGRALVQLLVGLVPWEILYLVLGTILVVPRSSLPGETFEEIALSAVFVVPVFYLVLHTTWLILSRAFLSAGRSRMFWSAMLAGTVIGLGLGLLQSQVPVSSFAVWLLR